MQIPDGLAWNKIKKGENTEFAGKLAAFLNLTQPIVTFILILIITKNYKILIPSAIVLIMYIINVIIKIYPSLIITLHQEKIVLV